MADRIAVLNAGKLVQVGTPGELYHRPRSRFIADFIGQSNLLPGKVVERNAHRACRSKPPREGSSRASNNGVPDRVMISIRPEQMRVVRDGIGAPDRNRITGKRWSRRRFLAKRRSICCG